MIVHYNPEPSLQSLGEDESRHCVKVLRKKKGDSINIVDGKGSLFSARITDSNSRKCLFDDLQLVKFEEPSKRIEIAISPTKNIDRTEWFLEKSVEIGLTSASFVFCERSERKVIKEERMRGKAISAMKQSGSLWMPVIRQYKSLSDFLAQCDAKQKFIAHLEDPETPHLFDAAAKDASSFVVLIGPEGDFSTSEIKRAEESGFKSVTLGRRRLRTETAGLVACHTLSLLA